MAYKRSPYPMHKGTSAHKSALKQKMISIKAVKPDELPKPQPSPKTKSMHTGSMEGLS